MPKVVQYNEGITKTVPKELHHLTEKSNVASILKSGLVVGSKRTVSKGGRIRGVYLTSDVYGVMAGGDFRIRDVAVMTVRTSGLTLVFDPEFYPDFDSDSEIERAIVAEEEAYYVFSKSSISASNIRLDKNFRIRGPGGVTMPNKSISL